MQIKWMENNRKISIKDFPKKTHTNRYTEEGWKEHKIGWKKKKL